MFWLSQENVGYFYHLPPKEGAVGGSSRAWWSGGEYYSLKLAPEGLRMIELETGEGRGI